MIEFIRGGYFTPLVLLILLLTGSGCSETSNQRSRAKSDTLKHAIGESLVPTGDHTSNNRLTEELIDQTKEDELLQLVFNNLSGKLPKDYSNEFEIVTGWNKSQQAIYIIWWLEAEVNNGGYNQFYVNSSRQFSTLAPAALRLVGATKFADLTSRANDTYKKENKKITRDQDGSQEGFSKSYDDNPLNKFDLEFYALYKIETLQQLQIAYIKTHKADFTDK